MKPIHEQFENTLERRCFYALIIGVSLAFLWILMPFFGAILWAYAFAVILTPFQRRYTRRFENSPNIRALLTLLLGLFLMILPVIFILVSFSVQVADIVEMVKSGEIEPKKYFEKLQSYVPQATHLLERVGIQASTLEDKLSSTASNAGSFLTKHTVSLGQNTFKFVLDFFLMLYLAFFFLRDGSFLLKVAIKALPMGDTTERILITRISSVVRATIKGNLVVACVQGGLGGIAFWLLGISAPVIWGVAMVFASLLPAVGAAIIWFPVAIYFFVSGNYTDGVILCVVGVGVIGLVDNILRPVLVGRDTGMPDYVVLLSTLGGLSLFGLNGFVVGPLIAALFIAVWGIFMGKNGDSKSKDDQPAKQD